eukprot:2047595-Ditylum_brightwellii.AAC.1
MAFLVMEDGFSLRLLRTSAKERVLSIDSVSESAVDEVVVMFGEGLTRDGSEVDHLAAGGKDRAIA